MHRYRQRGLRFSLTVWPILCALGAGGAWAWFEYKDQQRALEVKGRSDVEAALAREDIAGYARLMHRGKISLTDLYQRTKVRAEKVLPALVEPDAAAMKELAELNGRLYEASKKHDETLGVLEMENVLDATTLKDKADLEKRRAIVRNFRQANRDLQRILEGVSTESEVLEMRTVDERISTQILGGLAVLDEAWGHYKARSHDDVSFERTADQQRWGQILAEIADTQVRGQKLRASFSSSTRTDQDVNPAK